MKKFIADLIVIGLIINLGSPVWSEEKSSQGFSLQEVTVIGNAVSVTGSGIPKYNVFGLSKPERLVIDFSDTEYKLKQSFPVENSPIINKVRGAQFKDKPTKVARVVMELKTSDIEYEVNEENGNTVIIKFFPVASEAGTPAVEQAYESPKPQETLSSAPEVSAPAIETVAQAPASTEVKAVAEPQSVTVPMPKPSASQKSAEVSSNQTSKKIGLTSKPISFDFEAADVRDVLRVLSMKSGINIICGDDVQGTVTMRLENVPFDKAFHTILALKNLVAEESGPNIIRVVTPQQIALERERSVTFTKIFPLNYAKADEIKTNLDMIRQSEGRRGGISVDDRTNSLIVTDTPEGLQSAERIISELDRKPEQVIIEAKIVEITLNKSIDLGVQWQYAGTAGDPNVAIGASRQHVVADNESVPGPNATIGANRNLPSGTGTLETGGTGVAFPASPVSGQISSIAFGIVSNGNRLNAVLSALQQKGLSKLLSSPKVTTINNKEAKILIGQKIPYTTTTISVSGSTQQTNFLDVGIKLTVTPTINVDQKITLAVHPEVSLYIRADPAGPVIGTREANTTVLVNNGETVVIGGLITDEDRKLATQVPILGDIPIIGTLFKRTLTSKDRTELLVFITPQIVK
ncbi:MAG: type IV pilus secretin PilQ [Elusimicrobia bacterium]|nr:type IV pilus secretin PilQ [Elusimicrobiota bacterium]